MSLWDNWGDETGCDKVHWQEDFHGAFEKLLERYNKCIATEGDYFEGDKSFMCVLSIKVPIRKKSLETFNGPRTCTFPENEESWVRVIPIVIGAFGKVPKGLEQLEIGGRIEIIQTTALLRRILETWGNWEDLLSLNL